MLTGILLVVSTYCVVRLIETICTSSKTIDGGAGSAYRIVAALAIIVIVGTCLSGLRSAAELQETLSRIGR